MLISNHAEYLWIFMNILFGSGQVVRYSGSQVVNVWLGSGEWCAQLPATMSCAQMIRKASKGSLSMEHSPHGRPRHGSCPSLKPVSVSDFIGFFWIFRLKLSYVKIRARLTHILAISWHMLTFLSARSVTVSWLIKWFLCLCLEDPQCPLCVPFRKCFWSLNSLFRSCF